MKGNNVYIMQNAAFKTDFNVFGSFGAMLQVLESAGNPTTAISDGQDAVAGTNPQNSIIVGQNGIQLSSRGDATYSIGFTKKTLAGTVLSTLTLNDVASKINFSGDSYVFTEITAAAGNIQLIGTAPEFRFGANGTVAGIIKGGGITIKSGAGAANLNIDGAGGILKINNIQVVKAGVSGWTAASNTKLRTTFDTTTVTLPNLAARVGALIDDLLTHGLITA